MRHSKAKSRLVRRWSGPWLEPLPLADRRNKTNQPRSCGRLGERSTANGKGFACPCAAPRALLLLLALLCGIVADPRSLTAQDPSPSGSDHPWTLRGESDRQFIQRLGQLAERCDELGLTEQAERTRRWWIPRDPERDYLFLPKPAEREREEDDAAARGNRDASQERRDDERDAREAPEVHWRRHFQTARGEQAERLFALAEKSAERYPAEAFSLLHEVLHEAPDHAAARRILGFRPSAQGWSRPGDIIGVTRGRAAMASLGFAARQYHQVTTAHFRLLTDADPEQARRVAEQLEDLHQVWRQVFYRFWSDGPTLARRFQAGTGDFRARTDKHQVVWYRDRARYLEVLSRDEPRIEQTLGIYLDKKRMSFLYGDPREMLPSWLHEVTHQLFAETVRTAPDIGTQGHMWIAEGVALHFESLRWFPGFCMLGGFDADRLQFARYRALAERSVVPLAELTGLDRQTLQRDPRIGSLYSQAAGLTDFLFHGQGRRYREALIDYVKAVYSGRNDPNLLAFLANTTYSDLDKQYLEHLLVDDEQLYFCQPAVNLFLGHCPVTDRGWLHVPVDHLEWLDLGFTSVTDVGAKRIAEARQLKKLSLEHTRITSQILPLVATLDQLEYLDLSGLPIQDEDLAHLGPLERLESLWLTGTSIGDAGLRHLHPLRQLRTLDVSETKVTGSGLRGLKQVLPTLE